MRKRHCAYKWSSRIWTHRMGAVAVRSALRLSAESVTGGPSVRTRARMEMRTVRALRQVLNRVSP